MGGVSKGLDITVHESIRSLAASEWNALAPPDFPFSDHAYLRALEEGGCVGAEQGWLPWYVAARRRDALEGALALYAKDNSYGEYIFDWSWAGAYQRHGVPYYPKVVAAIPFTPATGPKLLVNPGARDGVQVRQALIDSALEATQAAHASSLHFLFLSPEEIAIFRDRGFLVRHSFQYHWRNRDYPDFEGFLAALKPRKRKQILRERAQLAETGLRIGIETGEALTPALARAMYALYLTTIEKMGAIAYLSERFFEEVFATMGHRIALVCAYDKSRLIAASILFKKGQALFGRYWGASEEVRNLHFELCYYQPIELAIREKLLLFEAGAQGEHKIARGFTPELTYSAHWIAHPEFRRAIAAFIEEERQAISILFEQTKEHLPYR